MDRDKAKVELKEAIDELFSTCGEISEGRNGYVGDDIVNLMAEAALNVLLATEDTFEYLLKEGIINNE